MIRLIVVGLLLTVAGGAAAYGEAAGYKCNIKHSLQLGKDGSAQPNALADQYRKMEFVIDRQAAECLAVPLQQLGDTKSWIVALINSHTKRSTLHRQDFLTFNCCKSENMRTDPSNHSSL
jgi:hypothetical protein